MMRNSRARNEAALRYSERLQREQEAPRLRDRVPGLATLRLEITDGRNLAHADSKHTRIIPVDTAPALFSLLCADHSCREGGHDVTLAVLDKLRAHQTRFEVEDTCDGSVGTAECGRKMLVEIRATYR
jgi:hypothetical protein